VILSDLSKNATQGSNFEDAVGWNSNVVVTFFGVLGQPQVAARLSRNGIPKL
jgi:hypothetical protein